LSLKNAQTLHSITTRMSTHFGNFCQRHCWVSTLLNGDLLSNLA